MIELSIEGNQLYSAILLYPDLNFLFLIILAIIKKEGEKFLTFYESDNTYNLGQTAMFAGGFLAFLLWLAYDLQPQASEDSSDQGHMESLTQEEGCC